jgi:hypothetical protein
MLALERQPHPPGPVTVEGSFLTYHSDPWRKGWDLIREQVVRAPRVTAFRRVLISVQSVARSYRPRRPPPALRPVRQQVGGKRQMDIGIRRSSSLNIYLRCRRQAFHRQQRGGRSDGGSSQVESLYLL